MKTEVRSQKSEGRSQQFSHGGARRPCRAVISSIWGRDALVALVALFAVKSFCLEPATATITNLRSESSSTYVSPDEFFRGATLLLTNCIAYSGSTTSSARQDLTGLTLTLAIGTTSTNITNAATASNATNGIWGARFTVPTNWDAPNVEFKLSNTNDTFTYPWKILKTKQSLQ